MKKKVLVTILCLSLLVLIALLSPFNKRVLISTSSPDGTTDVEIFDEDSIASLLLLSRNIRFSFWKNEKVIESDRWLIGLDGFPSEFEKQFHGFLWLNDNTLRVSRNPAAIPDEEGRIIIHNKNPKQISYILINARDLFLKFEPQPDEKLLFKVPRQGENIFISINVGFADGKLIKQSANFFSKVKDSTSQTHCVYIDDNEKITIINSASKGLQNRSEPDLIPGCDE